jgi:Holliday junction resolvase RusA-like endonuclease
MAALGGLLVGSLDGYCWPDYRLSRYPQVSRQELYFSAFGTPRPQGSKRYLGNGRFIEASDVKPWRKEIAEAVFRSWVATGDDSSFTDAVVVYATFYMPKGKSVKRFWPTTAPDLDKLCRALGDALSVDSKALADDSLIVRWEAQKVYAATPEDVGVRVGIKTMTLAEKDNDSVTKALAELQSLPKP